jgi:hypothetical protein
MKRVLIGMLSVLALACGTTNPLDDAWAKFEGHDYPGAHQAFSDLAVSNQAAAYVGLGWTVMRMDSLAAAQGYFSTAVTLPDSVNALLDGYAGWSFVEWALQNDTACISYANHVLSSDNLYVFSHDPSVNYQDLMLHQAYSYFRLGDYANCIDRIQGVDNTFIAPSLGDPDIKRKLLVKLEALLAAVT